MADWPPLKNSAFTITTPIYDNDGDIVTGAADLDSEVSTAAGTFTDCTNEASEIATASGIYTLALTSSEMNGDVIATITKTSTSNAKTAVNVMYTVTRQLIDLAFPTTSGRSIDVETTGEVGINLDNVTGTLSDSEIDTITVNLVADQSAATIGTVNALGAQAKLDVNAEADTALSDVDLDHLIQVTAGAEEPTDGSYLDQVMHKDVSQTFDPTTDSLEALRDTAPLGTTMRGTDSALLAASAPTNWSSMGIESDGDVHSDLQEWLGGTPNALQTGRVDGYLGATAAAVITATSIATDALGAAELAADAATEIADAVLKRDIDQVEATMALHSLGTAVLKAVSRIVDDAGTLKLYRTNGSTLHLSQTITTDAASDPIDELTVGV